MEWGWEGAAKKMKKLSDSVVQGSHMKGNTAVAEGIE
jgi:hypothetical protein